ncbi:MAG: hypothetical protein JO113_02785 [Candidatus Eremiobacteraeota bacterium]|nr:hypothetical protein [Candidatus Eremiobacteraeota bacterium]
MNMTGLVKYAGPLVALAMCSACGGGSPVAPSNAALSFQYVGRTLSVNGRLVTAARPPNPVPRLATIVPERHGDKHFEYIFSDYETYASIFDYPKSTKQIGTIYGDGGQGCTNVLYGYGQKTFWNIGGDTQITEYKVPQTPIKTLSDSIGAPSSCAMNARGDLAVGILYNNSGPGGGDIIIFKHARGSGTAYTTPLDEEFFDGYDPQGNLFADGFTGDRSGFELIELPKGSNKFQTITTSNVVQFPGSVQWDGKYLTVVDQGTNAVYQYNVSGTQATLKGTVTLSGAGDCAQTWIVRGLIYCADNYNTDGEVFKYPAGGSAIAVFTGNFVFPLGVTVAERPRH